MSDGIKAPTLFFVKNLAHQFDAVEKFLKKRGFKVFIEADIKTAIDRILEENPDYIFLSWDHKNENIRLMPKTIYASCTGQIVPFIMSTQRDQIIQLESSGFENKLYPPLSGPAIMRVISKHEKKSQIFEQINNKKTVEKKKQSNMIQVKSFFTQEDGRGPQFNLKREKSLKDNERKMIANRSRGQINKFMPQKQRKSAGEMNVATQSGPKRSKMSSTFQGSIKSRMKLAIEQEFKKNNRLTPIQQEGAKNKLMTAIEQQIAKDVSPEKLILLLNEEIAKFDELNPEEQQETTGKLIEVLNQNGGEEMPEIDMDEEDENLSIPMSEQILKENNGLSKNQVEFLEESFTETVKPELFDTLEAYADQQVQQLDLTTTTQIYILIVQELEWTGYLAIASESYLDIASAQDILNEWIKKMIHVQRIDQDTTDEDAMPDAVLMEIRVPKVDFADFCSYKSEFFKQVDFNDKKTMLGFFSFSPYQVINSVHSAHDMLELPVEFLQPNKQLPFDVNLWMPENKKFILYIRPGSFLEEGQLERLIKHKTKYIFSDMEYELPLLKYKAEFNIKALIESYNSIKGPKK